MFDTYLHIVSALVRRAYYLLILLNYKATGVPSTHSETYLRSALIENNQCMSVMAVYCVVRQIMLLRHTKFHICSDRQKQMQLITTCITTPSVAFNRDGTLRHAEARRGTPSYMAVCMCWQAFEFKKNGCKYVFELSILCFCLLNDALSGSDFILV